MSNTTAAVYTELDSIGVNLDESSELQPHACNPALHAGHGGANRPSVGRGRASLSPHRCHTLRLHHTHRVPGLVERVALLLATQVPRLVSLVPVLADVRITQLLEGRVSLKPRLEAPVLGLEVRVRG